MPDVKRRSVNIHSINLDKWVGLQITRRRTEIELTKEDLAAMTGCTVAEIRSFEFAWRRPKPAQILQLANTLGVRVSYFFDGYQV